MDTMGRKKLKNEELLNYRVETRVNAKKYNELQELLKKTINKDLSALLRDILTNRPIKTYTYDRTLDITMEELTALRSEIRAIGVNINQITRYFNTYTEDQRKRFYARIGFQAYQGIERKVDRLLSIIEKLSIKWLSK